MMSDTKTDVAAKCMLYLILIQIVTDDCYASSWPHASFIQNLTPGAKPRESIETRALVFTEN